MPSTTEVRFKKLHDDVQLPERQHDTDAGMDLRAYLPGGEVVLAPLQRLLVPCGFAMELEVGFEAQVRPRSGMAIKDGITVINSPGTIDASYRGEVKVALINLSDTTYYLQPGARIAQMVIQALPHVTVLEVTELHDSQRGQGGFGSTGTT